MMKTAPFSMRLDPAVKAALQRLANRERRSLTNYVEKLLVEHVEHVEPGSPRVSKGRGK
jgi:hypothetical protein